MKRLLAKFVELAGINSKRYKVPRLNDKQTAVGLRNSFLRLSANDKALATSDIGADVQLVELLLQCWEFGMKPFD